MKKSLYLNLITIFVLIILSGCRPEESLDSSPQKMKAVFSPYLTSAPLFIALDRGYFDDEGIQMELVTVGLSTDSLTALIRGEVDVITGGVSAAVLNAMGQGADIRFVASRGYVGADNCYLSFLASSGMVQSGYTPNTAVDGSRVVAREDNFMGYFFSKILEYYGRDASDFVNTPATSPIIVSLFGSGQLEFATSSEPTTSRVVTNGSAQVILSATEIIPDFDYGYLLYGPSILESDNGAGYKFMKAYHRGVLEYLRGKTDENIASIAQHTNLDAEIVKSVCWPEVRSGLEMPADGLMDFQKYAMAMDLLDTIVPYEQAVDSRFISKIGN